MTDYGIVRSTVKPQRVLVDDYSVWVYSDITAVTENDFEGFEYHEIQYGKNEYIRMIDEKNAALETQITNTQLALCELYEGVL